MALQYISDDSGNHTAVVIPIAEWNDITTRHADLKDLSEENAPKLNNASRFKGLLTKEETEDYLKYLEKARAEWDRDI